jgi:hypothetical protein
LDETGTHPWSSTLSVAGTRRQPLRPCHPELPELPLPRISADIEMVALELGVSVMHREEWADKVIDRGSS